MKKEKKLFPSQRENEEVFLLMRKHWFVYLPFFFFAAAILLSVVAGFALIQNYASDVSVLTEIFLIVFTSCYILLTLAILIYGFIDFYLDVDIVTNHRIVDIEQNGFFKRKVSELSLSQIEDVSAQVDGFFPTILHFGDLRIQTAGNKENFIFKSVHHPYKLAQLILDLQQAQKTNSSKILERCRRLVAGRPGRFGLFGPSQDPAPEVHDLIDHPLKPEPVKRVATPAKHAESQEALPSHKHVPEKKRATEGKIMREGEVIDF